jgi:PhoH-like ATPase
MSDFYSGIATIKTTKENIDELYRTGELSIDFDHENVYDHAKDQNKYVLLTDCGSSSAIVRVEGDSFVRVKLSKELAVSGIRGRNLEQMIALDVLLDPDINVVALTGSAGTGKTLLTLAAALQQVEDGVYDKIIITRPMSQVGQYELGSLPGDVSEKFNPYLLGAMCNFEHLVGSKGTIQDLIVQYHIEFVPLQLFRGASWSNTFLIADEVQVLNQHDMLTLGTRIGEGSKLVILGDLNQRDERIAKDKTGLHIWTNHELTRASSITASINLVKCERSKTAELFAKVLGGEG